MLIAPTSVSVRDIEHGIDTDRVDPLDRTILHFLLECPTCGDDVVLELIRQGVDINATDNNRNTALHKAALFSDGIATMKVLLDHGVDVDPINDLGTTPLGYATTVEKQLLLLNYGANINGLTNRTPLHIAVLRGSLECVQFLLDNGAKIDHDMPEPVFREVPMPCNHGVDDTDVENRKKIVELLLSKGGTTPNSVLDLAIKHRDEANNGRSVGYVI